MWLMNLNVFFWKSAVISALIWNRLSSTRLIVHSQQDDFQDMVNLSRIDSLLALQLCLSLIPELPRCAVCCWESSRVADSGFNRTCIFLPTTNQKKKREDTPSQLKNCHITMTFHMCFLFAISCTQTL